MFSPDDSGLLRILEEDEWRGIGITQSLGWQHFEVHGTFIAFSFGSCLIRVPGDLGAVGIEKHEQSGMASTVEMGSDWEYAAC